MKKHATAEEAAEARKAFQREYQKNYKARRATGSGWWQLVNVHG